MYAVIDTETTGLKPELGARIFLTGYKLYNAKFKCTKTFTTSEPADIKAILMDKSLIKIFHNAKFDIRMFKAHKLKVVGPIVDTLLLAKCCPVHFASYALESIAKQLWGFDDSAKKELKVWIAKENLSRKKAGKGVYLEAGYQDIPKRIMVPYFEADLTNPMELYKRLYHHLEDAEVKKIYDMEMKVQDIVIAMEERGMQIDIPYVKKSIKFLEKEINSLLADMNYKEGFDPGKDASLHWLLYDKLKLKPFKLTKTGEVALDADVLASYNIPELNNIIRYRKLSKLKETYFKNLLDYSNKDGILSCSIWQYGAKTGRMSMTEPALQTIPKEEACEVSIRKAFIPRKGFYNWTFDFKQIEVVMFAYFCNDENLLRAVRDLVDMHQMVADTVGINRKEAKTMQFAVLYGMGRMALIKKFIELGCETKEFADEFMPLSLQYDALIKTDFRAAMDIMGSIWKKSKTSEKLSAYFGKFPAIEDFKKDVTKLIKERAAENEGIGFVQTWAGRKTAVPEREAYKGVNYIIQGSAADVMKIAMIKVFDLLSKSNCSILLPIHDELIIEIPIGEETKWLPKIKVAMTDFPDLDVPINVSVKQIKKSWDKTKELK